MSERSVFLAATFLVGSLGAQAPVGTQPPPVADAPKTAIPQLLPPLKEGDMPCDSKDQQAVIVGATTRELILAHRPIFKTNMDKADVPPELTKRWQNLSTPCTLVVAFGSWCGDSQREMAGLLALMAEGNPFVKIHLLGVYRDKKVASGVWPMGLEEQPVVKVPTFWFYALEPGGCYRLVGSIVENPPKKGQAMAEAVVELLEQVR